jgi:FkbM family methyltransferase
MSKKIFVEVGANTGSDSDKFVTEDSLLFCFEPAMELAYKLWEKYKRKNVIVLPFAVDKENAIKQFNISGTINWGCSSLNDFSPDIHEKWANRPDFIFTDSYNVPTITLYDFISMYNIEKIDYLWIDAQGSDFNVIKGLGDKISIVEEGKCEAAHKVDLYHNVNNHYTDIIDYLHAKNFETSITLDQSGFGAECDVIFKKK